MMQTDPNYFIEYSLGLDIWLMWLAFLIVIIGLSLKFRKSDRNLDRIGLVWLAILSILVVVTSIFGGVTISSPQIDLFSMGNISVNIPRLMTMIAIPWMLSVCYVGTFPAVALAIASGFLYAFLETHSISTPLIFAAAALLFGYFLRNQDILNQGKKISQPIKISLAVIFILSPLLLLTSLIDFQGNLGERLISAFSNFKISFIVYGIEILIGGIACKLSSKFVKSKTLKNNLPIKQINYKQKAIFYSFIWIGVSIITISVFWSRIYFIDETSFNIPFSLGIGLILFTIALIGWYKGVLPQVITQIAIWKMEKMRGSKSFGFFESAKNRFKNNELLKELELLQKYVTVQADINRRLLNIDPVIGNGLENILTSILKAALGAHATSARIILLDQKSKQGINSRRLRMGLGSQHKLYAYLDEFILNQIGDLKRLILSDLRDKQFFELSPGLPFPDSLIALALLDNEKVLGYLWVGFDSTQWFSEEDIAFYDMMAHKAAVAIQNSVTSTQEQTQRLKFETILNSIPDPILLIDQTGLILYSNEAASKLAGLNGLGLTEAVSELVKTGTIHESLREIKQAPYTKTIKLANKLEFTATLCKIRIDGEEELVLLILNDLSSIRKINAQKSEFVTTVSHGLRKYLSMINGYVTILPNIGNLSPQQQIYTQRIITEIYGMQKLVDNVLNLEHLDTNKPLQLSSIKIKDLVLSAIKPLELFAQQKKIVLNVEYNGSGNREMIADVTLMQQALLNLIDNAIKYSTMSSKVDVIINMDNDRTIFAVKDHGIGIAPLDVPKLFTKYFHLESSSYQQHRGSGLGLAIVQSIAEKHGGKALVTSQLGKGSTFTIEVPVIDDFSIPEEMQRD